MIEQGRVFVIRIAAHNGNKIEGRAYARWGTGPEMAVEAAVRNALKRWKGEEGWRLLIMGVEPLILGRL